MKTFKEHTEEEKRKIIERNAQSLLENIVGWSASRIILKKAGIRNINWKIVDGDVVPKEKSIPIELNEVIYSSLESETNKLYRLNLEQIKHENDLFSEWRRQLILRMQWTENGWKLDVEELLYETIKTKKTEQNSLEQLKTYYLEKGMRDDWNQIEMKGLFEKGESFWKEVTERMRVCLNNSDLRFKMLEEYLNKKIKEAENAFLLASQSELFQSIIYESLMENDKIGFRKGDWNLWHIGEKNSMSHLLTTNELKNKTKKDISTK